MKSKTGMFMSIAAEGVPGVEIGTDVQVLTL